MLFIHRFPTTSGGGRLSDENKYSYRPSSDFNSSSNSVFNFSIIFALLSTKYTFRPCLCQVAILGFKLSVNALISTPVLIFIPNASRSGFLYPYLLSVARSNSISKLDGWCCDVIIQTSNPESMGEITLNTLRKGFRVGQN
jgi:hypothetical protein